MRCFFVLAATLVIGSPVESQTYNQRLGITTDHGSWYRYYNSTPTRAQLERDGARLDALRARLESEKALLNKKADAYNEALESGKEILTQLRSDIASYNARNAELERQAQRLNESWNEWKEERDRYTAARESSTASEYIQRIGASDGKSTQYTYYNSDGTRSSSKMRKEVDRLNAVSNSLSSQNEAIRKQSDAMKPIRNSLERRSQAAKEWTSAMNSYNDQLNKESADYKQRMEARNKWVQNFNAAQAERQRIEERDRRQRELEQLAAERRRYNQLFNQYNGPVYDHR